MHSLYGLNIKMPSLRDVAMKESEERLKRHMIRGDTEKLRNFIAEHTEHPHDAVNDQAVKSLVNEYLDVVQNRSDRQSK